MNRLNLLTKFVTNPSIRSPLLAFGLAAVAAMATAAESPPELMTVQSYITDDAGTPLGNATPENKAMQFVVFTAEEGGESVFAESQTVTVDKGYFSAILGEGTAISGDEKHNLATAFTGSTASDRYIEIQVEKDGGDFQILSPRLRILPTAYSFLSSYANVAGSVDNAVINTAALDDGAVTSAKVENESLKAEDLAPNSVGTSEVAPDSLKAEDLGPNSVGNSELGGDLTLTGRNGVNIRWPDTAFGVRGNSGDSYMTFMEASDGDNLFYVNAAGTIWSKNGLSSSMVDSAAVKDNTLTYNDLAADSVRASEIAANQVGNSELASDLTFSGAIGINQRYPNVALTTKTAADDDYITYNLGSGGSLMSYQKVDGFTRMYRRVSTNPSYLSILSLTAVTPNSGTDNWELAIDVNDNGGGDEDLFFYLGGVQKGWLEADGSGFKASSDVRLKQDIVDFDNLLERAIQLRPRTYRFKSNPDGKPQVGFIAQEVQDIFPGMVDSDEEFLGLSYDKFSVVAIGAIKELNAKVETLESENAALGQKNAEVEERLTALEALVQSLAK